MSQAAFPFDLRRSGRAVFLALCVVACTAAHARQGFSEPALFDGENTGSASQSALAVGVDGALYGTAEGGGRHGVGTVFRYVPGQAIEAIHHFDGVQGARPRAGLLRLPDGSLWGVAGFGGAHDRGTVFRVMPGGEVTLVHAFDGVDGEYPLARLTLGRDGLVYGATSGLTDAYAGSVFRIDPANGRLQLLHRFEGTTDLAPLGHSPTGRLLQAADGYLYGTAYKGGVEGRGTLYRVDPRGGAVELVHSFRQGEGCNPYAGLTEGPDGALYGVAGGCGKNNSGTVFRAVVSGLRAKVRALHHFHWFKEASSPVCDLLLASDGHLYGCTHDLGYGSGFRILPSGRGYSRFVQAGPDTPSKGAFPWGQMLEHGGALWGTLSQGVSMPHISGSIYRLATTPPPGRR